MTDQRAWCPKCAKIIPAYAIDTEPSANECGECQTVVLYSEEFNPLAYCHSCEDVRNHWETDARVDSNGDHEFICIDCDTANLEEI